MDNIERIKQAIKKAVFEELQIMAAEANIDFSYQIDENLMDFFDFKTETSLKVTFSID